MLSLETKSRSRDRSRPNFYGLSLGFVGSGLGLGLVGPGLGLDRSGFAVETEISSNTALTRNIGRLL